MRLIFVRHGEPDYVNDTLTEKGWREAELLSERISKWNVTKFYCSPLGRAKDTASCTLKKMNRTAETLDWIKEFFYPIDDPVTGRHGVPWDFVPSCWSDDPLMFDSRQWVNAQIPGQNPMIASAYQSVCQNMDELLSSYGYQRKNHYYQMPDAEERFISSTVSPSDLSPIVNVQNTETTCLVFFCHLGITCIILSHLLNIPFQSLVHGIFLPTTSITVLNSEERWGKEAYFRAQAMGDVHHLLKGKEPLSSAGSFSIVFEG